MQQLIDEFKTMDIYGWFFTFIGVSCICMILGAVGIVLANDTEHGNPLIIYPIATLFATFVMLNLGNQSASAKEVFWGWIIITFGFAALSVIGIGMMWLIASIT